MFEKIQAVVVFFFSMLNVWDFLFFSDAVSFILVFIIFEPLLLPVFFDTGNGTIYESILDKIRQKEKRKAPVGFEPMTSCLLDRRSNHLSHGASLEKVCTAMSDCRTETEQLLLKKG